MLLAGCGIGMSWRIPTYVFETPEVAIGRALFVCAEVRAPIQAPLRIMMSDAQRTPRTIILQTLPQLHPTYACGITPIAYRDARPGGIVRLWFSAADLKHVETLGVLSLASIVRPSELHPHLTTIGGQYDMYEFEWAEGQASEVTYSVELPLPL